MATAITEENVQKTVYEALPQFGVDESQITRDATFEDLDVDSLDLAARLYYKIFFSFAFYFFF
jgi:acyl carrier protein